MEGERERSEEEGHRPPRLPSRTRSQSQSRSSRSTSSSNNSSSSQSHRSRNRGRSETRRTSYESTSASASASNSISGGISLSTRSTASLSSASNSYSRSNNGSGSTSIRRSRSLGHGQHHRHHQHQNRLSGVDEGFELGLGFDTIAFTPQPTRTRSRSSSRHRNGTGSGSGGTNAPSSSTRRATNAPKKKVKTHSKQHVIKKQLNRVGGSASVNSRHFKKSQRSSSMGPGYRSDANANANANASVSSNRSRSRRNNEYDYEYEYQPPPSTTSTTSSRRSRSHSRSRPTTTGSSRTHGERGVPRSRSRSRSRPRSVSNPRARSRDLDNHNHNNHKNENQYRSRDRSSSRPRRRSASQTRSVCSNSNVSFGGQSFEVEPNVHHNAIMSTEIQCPVIAEMKENELYAKRAGINFTAERGDEIAMFDQDLIGESDYFTSHEDLQFETIHITPMNQHKTQPGGFLFDDEAMNRKHNHAHAPPPNRFIGNDADLEQLKVMAGQLCGDWGAKEYETPTIARRIIDFQFAQEKRRKKFGNERPWGILGLYDHLSAVRADVEWAEIAACRRANGEPYKAWFEFVEEQSTGKNRPFFTIIILFICTGFMLASIHVNGWKIEPFSHNPMVGPSADTLVKMGAKESKLIVLEGEVWRLVSPMILHAGLIHYTLNMLALWFVGKAIEQCHGFFASMLLFVAPAIGGTILSAIFLPNMISVGASGGIFGLIGACIADIYMNWNLLFNKFVNGNNKHAHVWVLFALIMDIVVNSLIGLTPFVDNFTHLGGMIFGFMCGTSTMQRISTDMFDSTYHRNKTIWTRTKKKFFQFFGIILTLTAMAASLTILMQGDGTSTPCKSCMALSCVTFPPWAGEDNKWWYCDDCGAVTADATINPQTKEFDSLAINCPRGDIFTMDIVNDMETDRGWLEKQLPRWCRAHCEDI